MTLTAFPNPHHIQYPRGVKCLDCEEFAPAELERCIACGSSAVALIEDGEWDGGPPEPGHPHFVEIDCSTGMVGYTRLTREELTEKAKADAASHSEEHERLLKRGARVAMLREKATVDPHYAALLEHLGIDLNA